VTRWKRPSPAGRRLALERKFGANVDYYGGAVSLLTLRPPGQDLLPWGDEERLVSGSVGDGNAEFSRLVEYPYREVWNCTAQRRASRLFEAAQRTRNRFVKRQWGGELPRQIGNVRSEQKRGVWHFHWLLPMGTRSRARVVSVRAALLPACVAERASAVVTGRTVGDVVG
jgi:hypothetical protein